MRKVVLWSRQPWSDADPAGDPELPASRFIQATTVTRLGPITATGVCIPWPDAGRPNGRARWEEHGRYLNALDRLLPRPSGDFRLLLGDFNQHIPRIRAPVALAARLRQVLNGRFQVATAGDLPASDAEAVSLRAIDHLAHGAALACTGIAVLGHYLPDGRRMSDRPALMLTLARAGFRSPSA
ncbi:hypothetical protein [Ancylobacter amanitiformis]|uniref:Endonuclease/exonuclease/phosphatase domain-containing protein n=1 Tax=Ancylobacter amanitiformis TaxID=217069 RepID=A0ABU0LLW0_9HYPH|nr:hypothetical protein [Ancylobacter amanitiformis]MDQ0509697.1 hypothetical protein [Ancylobacter amanitiformis]